MTEEEPLYTFLHDEVYKDFNPMMILMAPY